MKEGAACYNLTIVECKELQAAGYEIKQGSYNLTIVECKDLWPPADRRPVRVII